MEGLDSAIRPQDLTEFKRIGPNTPSANVTIPESAENRIKTDTKFFYAYIIFTVLLIPFIIYSLAYSDLRRLSMIHDDCGNYCGGKNTKYDKWNCSGMDYTDKKYIQLTFARSKSVENINNYDFSSNDEELQPVWKCVSECNDDEQEILTDVCIPSLKGDSFSNDVEIHKAGQLMGSRSFLLSTDTILRVILSCFISIGISVWTMYLFRYAVHIVVWTVFILVFVLGFICVVLLWTYHGNRDTTLCVFSTIFLLIYVLILYLARNRIKMVILLLRETATAIFDMPQMIGSSILVVLLEMFLFCVWLGVTICMSTASELTEDDFNPNRLTYKTMGVVQFSIFYNSVMGFWGLIFVSGAFYMTIAGAISNWYFAKDKKALFQPLKTSASIVYKFHLGTVAFGSLIILLAAMIRATLRNLAKGRCFKACVDWFLRQVERFLECLTKRAYVLTAMHGQPFLRSGKRAAQLILTNMINISAVSFVKNFTFCVCEILIGLVSVMISALIFSGNDSGYVIYAYLIVFVFAISIALVIFSVFETAIDTIFICFCEDRLLNDGMARPYAMSEDLEEFVASSKKLEGEKLFKFGVGAVKEKQVYQQQQPLPDPEPV